VYDEKNNLSHWDFDPDTMKPVNILHTTVGYQALLEILVDILPGIEDKHRFSTEGYATFTKLFSRLPIADVTRYPFTSKSKNIFYYDMSLLIDPAVTPNDRRVKHLQELLKSD
jgi:hypothetical protein